MLPHMSEYKTIESPDTRLIADWIMNKKLSSKWTNFQNKNQINESQMKKKNQLKKKARIEKRVSCVLYIIVENEIENVPKTNKNKKLNKN